MKITIYGWSTSYRRGWTHSAAEDLAQVLGELLKG
jgi:hypothetical protein